MLTRLLNERIVNYEKEHGKIVDPSDTTLAKSLFIPDEQKPSP